MGTHRFSNLPSVRKQHLLVEFAGLKYACPHGVFMSLTPGDPTLWSGVLFVRRGPYSPSILRFQISFPPSYPSLPPLVTFSTDIFHPLITPLTTYMYTTDIQAETVSATDEERLPPGGFSLRSGFPDWFGRRGRRGKEVVRKDVNTMSVGSPSTLGSGSPTPRKNVADGLAENRRAEERGGEGVSTIEVLRYIKSTFDDEDVLDRVPLEAAGNPGAWHAWRTYRVKMGKIFEGEQKQEKGSVSQAVAGGDGTEASPTTDAVVENTPQKPAQGKMEKNDSTPASKQPGEWNWDGVWEVRVKRGVEASLSEATLYGREREGGDDLIRFLNLESEQVEGVMGDIRRSLEVSET